MPRLSRLSSIRAQVVAMVALITVSMTALLVWGGVREYRNAVDLQERTALAMAEAVAVGTQQFMSQASTLLANVAAEQADALLDPARCESVAQPVRRILDFLTNVMVAEADGEIVCSTIPTAGTGLRNVADRAWFRLAVAEAGVVVSAPHVGSLTEAWVVPIAVAIRDADGRTLGVLAGSLDLSDFQQVLTRVRLHEDELLTIVSRDSIVLARSHEPERWVGTFLGWGGDPDEVEVFPGGWLTHAPDADGVPRTFGKVLVPGLGWKVSLGIPSADARAPAIRSALRWGAASLVLLLVGTLLAWRLYRTVDRSLIDLRRGARAAAEGALVSVPDDAPAEVRDVVTTLNRSLERRAEAQEAERRAKERYQSILTNAVFGIYVSTEDGRFHEVNPALAEMLGYDDPADLKERGIAGLYRDPEQRARLVQLHADRGVIEAVELEWVRLDGAPITVRLNGKVLEGPEGRLYEVMVEDITQERRREEELRHHQKLEAVGQLAGGIAHDFNNIMTVIGGNIELIQSSLGPDDPLQADIRQITDATERANQLTGQLLSFSRKSPVDSRPVNLTEVISSVERMLGRLIGEDIQLETRVGPDLMRAFADAGRLEQVLVNLVLNGRDALPAGGRILVEAHNTPTADGRPFVTLSVTDDGIGMDEATLAHIFEPFFTTKASGRGTGLGLANVYGIVRQAGGEIRVRSKPGEGSRFDVTLPGIAPAGRSAAVASPGPSEEGAPAREHVLVVEDKESVRSLVTRILERDGYTVYGARDGLHALDRIQNEGIRVDLVLTDVIMPRMKGPELAERLAELAPDVPVLFMSGYLDSADLRSRFSRMPDLFLAKPFTANEVKERVRAAIDQYRAGASV
ncbi:MAG: response regulator [Longimicrobiales bacterium]